MGACPGIPESKTTELFGFEEVEMAVMTVNEEETAELGVEEVVVRELVVEERIRSD